MKARSHCAHLGILLLSALMLTSTYTMADNTGRIMGKVSDTYGHGIAYATVAIQNLNTVSFTAEDGSFTLEHITYGNHELSVSLLGFQKNQVKIQVNDSLQQVNITLLEETTTLPTLSIIGKRDLLFSGTPGSVAYIDAKELLLIQPLSGNEVLRKIPGIHVVDEEGVGLRLNMGIRGLSPDKSRNVLVLEDGIPVALNPYAEPELYYTPPIDRMQGIEILKGSGQILYGPQTIGGVVNYITANPSKEQRIYAKTKIGQGQFLTGIVGYSNTFKNTGVDVQYLRKQADHLANVAFTLDDVNAKVVFKTGNKGTLTVKLGAYRENSNATYVGLTQHMFDVGGNDFDFLAPDDKLMVSRYSTGLIHKQAIGKNTLLQSTFFAYQTARNWRRQAFSYSNQNGTLPSDFSGQIWGDTSNAGAGILMRNATGNRDRQFQVIGLEQRVSHQYRAKNTDNELTFGYRLMHEKGFEQRINGTYPKDPGGTLINDEIRKGNALSLYLQNKTNIGKKLEISYGVRSEIYQFNREILVQNTNDTQLLAQNTIAALMPGAGFNYKLNSKSTIFGGIHKGFAPPRIKDAIDFSLNNPVLELKAEESWNYEIGMRSTPLKGIYIEITGFYMDFENQIIPSSESIGGQGFGLANAGKTVHAGIEVQGHVDAKVIAKTKWTLQYDVSLAYIYAAFSADRIKEVNGEEINIKGNRTPYAPSFLATNVMHIASPSLIGLKVTHTYVGSQFGDDLNMIQPSANGRNGQINAYHVVDMSLYKKLKKHDISFHFSVKNIGNQRYIATRRPEGIRVGLPRFFMFGVDFAI